MADPRGFDFLSTCIFWAKPKDLPTDSLVFFNMQAGTCNTDLCNTDCNKAG